MGKGSGNSCSRMALTLADIETVSQAKTEQLTALATLLEYKLATMQPQIKKAKPLPAKPVALEAVRVSYTANQFVTFRQSDTLQAKNKIWLTSDWTLEPGDNCPYDLKDLILKLNESLTSSDIEAATFKSRKKALQILQAEIETYSLDYDVLGEKMVVRNRYDSQNYPFSTWRGIDGHGRTVWSLRLNLKPQDTYTHWYLDNTNPDPIEIFKQTLETVTFPTRKEACGEAVKFFNYYKQYYKKY